MNITLDRKAYDSGYDAGKAGQFFSDACPYPPMTIESLSWHSGFIEGRCVGQKLLLRCAPIDPNEHR